MLNDSPNPRSDWKKVPQAFPQPRDPANAGLGVNPSCDFTQAGSLPAAGGAKGDQGLMYSGLLKTDSCCVQRGSKVSELFEKVGKHYVQRHSKLSELPEDDGNNGRTGRTGNTGSVAGKSAETPAQALSKVSESGGCPTGYAGRMGETAYAQRHSKVSELPEDDGADGQKAEKNDNTPVQRDSKVSELDLAAGVLPGLPVFPVFPYRTVIRSTWRKMPGEGYRFFFRADFTGKLHFRDFAEDFA